MPPGLGRASSPHLSPDLLPRRGLDPGSPGFPQKLPKKKEEVTSKLAQTPGEGGSFVGIAVFSLPSWEGPQGIPGSPIAGLSALPTQALHPKAPRETLPRHLHLPPLGVSTGREGPPPLSRSWWALALPIGN